MKSLGFTLMEVLIALVILSISLTAVIKATSSDIQNTERLEEVSVAQWVATDAFNLIKLGAIQTVNGETTQITKMADKKWRWHANLKPSLTPGLTDIRLKIYLESRLVLSENDTMLGATR